MQFKGMNLAFESLQGITTSDPRNGLFLFPPLEYYVLHHSAAEKLQAQPRSMFILPNRSQVSVIHQHKIASANVWR